MKNVIRIVALMLILSFLSIQISSCSKSRDDLSGYTEIQKKVIFEDKFNVKDKQSAKDYLSKKCNKDYNDSYYLDPEGNPKYFDCSIIPLKDEDIKYLSFFPQMVVVHITGRNITDEGLIYLVDFNLLEGFSLINTSVNGQGFKHLKKLTRLDVVDFSGSPITDGGCKYISEIKFESPINEAIFNNTKITDKGLSYLSKLQFSGILMLNDTVITDEGLQYLANQKDLQELWLVNTKVTIVGVQWLQKELPKLSIWLERME